MGILKDIRNSIFDNVKNVSDKINKNFETYLINANINDIFTMFFDFNLKNIKIDSLVRKIKDNILKGLVSYKVIDVFIIKFVDYYFNKKIKDKDFYDVFYDVCFFYIINNKHSKVVNLIEYVEGKNVNQFLYSNWKYYLYGKLHYFMILSRDYNQLLINNTIRKLNEVDVENIIEEMEHYENKSFDKNIFNYHDLLWLIHKPSMFACKQEFETLTSSIIQNTIVKLDEQYKEYRESYNKYLKYVFVKTKNSIDIIKVIKGIIERRDIIYYRYSKENPVKIENFLKSNIDNVLYVYYVFIFSLSTDKVFYFDFRKFLKVIKSYKMENIESFISMIVNSIPNIKENFLQQKRGK